MEAERYEDCERQRRQHDKDLSCHDLQPDVEPDDCRCVECGMVDPPSNLCRSSEIDWIECDVCHFWYHQCCVNSAFLPRGKNTQKRSSAFDAVELVYYISLYTFYSCSYSCSYVCNMCILYITILSNEKIV